MRRSTEGPSTVVSPSSSRPSSKKNAFAASRSSTTRRTLSIRSNLFFVIVIKLLYLIKPSQAARDSPTVCVTGRWAGVDSAWEQKKLEASLSWPTGQGKILENAADSHLSSARCVRWLFPALFDNGGKPRHCQSGAPPKARAPIERDQGGMVCHLPL